MARGLFGFIGDIKKDRAEEARQLLIQKALEDSKTDVSGLPLEDQVKLSTLRRNRAEVQALQQNEGFLRGGSVPSPSDIRSAITPSSVRPISPQVTGVQAPLDILSAGGVPPTAPIDLLQRQAEKAIDANIGIQKSVTEQESKERAKLERTREETLKNQSLFITRLGESFNEIKDSGFAAATEVGIEGALTRAAGRFAAEQGIALPKTGAFLKDIKVLANQQARNIEGGRVTDQDRQIYADAMANVLGAPTIGNVSRAANTIIRLHNKYEGGIFSLIEDISKGNNELTDAIVLETLRLMTPEDRKKLKDGNFKRFNK